VPASLSAAMRMTGHKTEAVHRRYAIVDKTMLREGADKLATYQWAGKSSQGPVVRLKPTELSRR
jgi:hypothetical protein